MLQTPGMGVPIFTVVNVGLGMMFLGAVLLLLIAIWWSWTGDGIEIPRERWPGTVRLAAVAGWLLWAGGIGVQIAGQFDQVGVARW
jgi:hypothetical protein